MKNIAKRLGLSVIAASVLVTVSNAGTLKGLGNNKVAGPIPVEKISKEYMEVKKGTTNVHYDVSSFAYTPTDIKAGALSNPTFNYQIIGSSMGTVYSIPSDANLSVFRGDASWRCGDANDGDKNGTLIANNVEITSTENGRALIFNRPSDSDEKAYNGAYYYICEANSTDSNDVQSIAGGYSLLFNMKDSECGANPSGLQMKVRLYSGDSQELVDEATADMLHVESQFKICKLKGFNAQIDPAQNFAFFVGSQGSGCSVSSASDDLEYRIQTTKGFQRALTIGGNSKINFVVNNSGDLSANLDSVGLDGASAVTTFAAGKDTDYDGKVYKYVSKVSIPFGTTDQEKNITATYNLKAGVPIPETDFNTNITVKGTANGDRECPLMTNADAGSWTYAGYIANIPAVSYVKGAVDTVITVVNKDKNDAKIMIDVTNAEGKTISKLYLGDVKAGSIAKVKASDIVAAAQAQDATFTGSTMSVKLFVAADKNKVFSYASFKNDAKNLFKDLPVYDNNDAQH